MPVEDFFQILHGRRIFLKGVVQLNKKLGGDRHIGQTAFHRPDDHAAQLRVYKAEKLSVTLAKLFHCSRRIGIAFPVRPACHIAVQPPVLLL